jgi:hypothetical protein
MRTTKDVTNEPLAVEPMSHMVQRCFFEKKTVEMTNGRSPPQQVHFERPEHPNQPKQPRKLKDIHKQEEM